MHPRRRLQKIIDETSQLIRDVQWWNDNRLDAEPIDCEVDQMRLRLAKRVATQWDAGNRGEALSAMNDLFEYTKNER